ncbi:MAG: polysaccharide lyase family 8 super-sandwich domain-containing protein, partial [Acutalibacteraceae bacterium]
MKRVLSLILTAALLLVTIGALPVLADDAQLADMALIKSRFAEYFLHNSSVGNYGDLSKAEEYLATIREDGSWADIDYYNDTNTANGLIWQPKKALARMLAMAIFYADPQGGHYHDAAMLTGVQKGMEYWRSIRGANPENANFEGPWCSNWWENGFGIGQYVYKIGILLEKELTAENLAFICRKLDTFGSTNTGQNALWQTQNALHRALLENNADQFRKIVDQCLAVNLDVSGDMGAEALMVDNSFHAHGNLMYSNGYGKSLIQDLSLWIYYLRDTSFALPQKTLDLMADYILDGNRWMIRGDMLELGTVYQNHNQNWAYNNYAVPLRRMIESDPERAAEYQIMLDNLSGLRADNGLSGNKDMWTSAYMSHMREGYGVNVRTDTAGMKSTEWRSNWPDGGRLCLVFWTTAAMTTVMVDGHEYSDVLPTYDWRHLPGTTAPHYYSDRENDFDNGNDDSIGVSNGVTGAMSYVYEKTD